MTTPPSNGKNDHAIRMRQKAKRILCLKLSKSCALASFVANVERACQTLGVSKIAAPEGIGATLAAAAAERFGWGLIIMLKSGTIKEAKHDSETFTDYSGSTKRLSLLKETVQPNDRVLVMDDYIETGAQARAMCALLRRAEAVPTEIVCLCKGADANTDGLPIVVPVEI